MKIYSKISANIDCIISYNSTKLMPIDEYRDFELGTFANSLYGFIYAMTAEDLTKGTGLQICSNPNCKSYFRLTRSDRIYCSTQCNDAVRQKDRRNKVKAMAELSNEYPSVEKQTIEKIVKKITKEKHLSAKEIKQKFYIEVQNDFKTNI